MEKNENALINRIKKNLVVKRIRIKRQLYKSVYKYRLSPFQIRVAEKSFTKRKEIVENSKKDFPEKSGELKKIIDKILIERADEYGESEKYRTEMYFAYFAYGFSPNEYVCYNLKEKSIDEWKRFISDRESVCIGYKLNDIDYFPIFNNKINTYKKFKKYYQRDAISIKGEKDKKKFFEFINKHRTFVKKNANESCGRSIELIDLQNIADDEESLFQKFVSETEMILEEVVYQGTIMENLNPSSVNTVRCITLNTKQGIVTPYCFLKVGRKGAFIDNGKAGGILVGIDNMYGVLNTEGVDELGKRYVVHPDSGIAFKEYQLPEWERLLSVCKEMSSQVPEVAFVGWDMAYTSKGWIVIEGNALSEVIGPQATTQEGIRDTFMKYMKNMKLMY